MTGAPATLIGLSARLVVRDCGDRTTGWESGKTNGSPNNRTIDNLGSVMLLMVRR
jgi:hypothetical protein